jgi:hypothetical protein
MSIVDALLHLFPETVTGQPGIIDRSGNWVASGTAVTLPARYEGVERMVRNTQNQEVTSTLTVIVAGVATFKPSLWRFTLPDRYSPHEQVQALSTSHESDENGPVYQELYF